MHIKQVCVAPLRSAMSCLLASRAERGIGCLATLIDSLEKQQGTFYGALQPTEKGMTMMRALKRGIHHENVTKMYILCIQIIGT